MAHNTVRLELRRGGLLRRLRTGGPWEVRVENAGGRLLARVPAGASVFEAGRVHEEMCENIRRMSEDAFLKRYRG